MRARIILRRVRIRRLLVATTNAGKIREIQRILAGTPVELVTLADVPPVPEPAETGRTFADNAREKAEPYARATSLTTVAEDSGLAIDALDGRPGVESARYPGATYPDKFANLYQELRPHARPWTARYVCAVAVMGPGPGARGLLFSCLASVEGEISPEPRGTHGFGYDPIFFYPPFGATFGELTDARKAEVSHRGQAFRQVRAWVQRVADLEIARDDH
jgi:XTP/dITP diphosphohydrolase